jgi:Flp pilus assembly CpaF family ATPase
MHGVKSLDEYRDDGGFDRFDWVDPTEVERPTSDALAEGGEAVRQLLIWMVQQRKNVIVVGGTSSGKTTFLNALLAEVPHNQRVLTIEDTAELQILAPNAVCLEADERAGVPTRACVKLALRMRPDRIIVGEVRGGEAYDLLDAMNTGHPGSACSLHADSPQQGLSRLETLVGMHPDASNVPHRVIQTKIGEAIDFVIFCSRRGSRRGPEQILELIGTDDKGYVTNLLFNARSR